MAKAKRHVSGFCSVGAHEGTKVRSIRNGIPLKVCELWQDCGCTCHEELNKIHELTQTERISHGNPEYMTPKSTFVMPRPEDFLVLASVVEASNYQAAPKNPLDLAVKNFDATPTGKRARGQLEDQVLDICKQFMRGLLEVEILLPSYIASQIDEVDPPSVGAIGAVFDRWVKLGFARCSKGPVRFDSFTAEGLEVGLETMKARVKRDAKLKQGEASRTLRSRR